MNLRVFDIFVKVERSGPGRQLGLERASRLGPPNRGGIMIEQLGVITARPQTLEKAARLLVGSVIDTFMEGQDPDLLASHTAEILQTPPVSRS